MNEEKPDITTQIHGWYKSSRDHSQKWREKARESFDFYAGRQWSDDDVSQLEEQKRPAVTFNRVKPVIDAVAGFESSNRQEVRFLPRSVEDGGVAEVYTNAGLWARDESEAEDHDSDAFRDLAICGMGWVDLSMDYDRDPMGKICWARKSPLDLYWDPDCSGRNLGDAKWVIERCWYSRDQLDELWPDREELEPVSNDEAPDLSEPHDNNPKLSYDHSAMMGYDKTAKKYVVLRCQRVVMEVVYRVAIGQRIVELPKERFSKIKDALDARGIRYVKGRKRVVYQTYVCGKTVLEDGPAPCGEDFSIQAMTGFRDETDGVWYGLMEAMKDPQRWSNKFFSQFHDIVAANAKGGLLAEKNAFANPKKAEEDWARADALIILNEGGLGKVKERAIGQYPQAVDRLLQIATSATRDVTGINLEFLGMAAREQAGMVEMERKRSVITILSDILQSLRQYRRRQGKVLLHYIHSYIPEGRLIRIMGPEGAKYVPFARDPEALTYDIIVDESPTSPNAKHELWQMLTSGGVFELLKVAVTTGSLPPAIILDILKRGLPLPETVTSAWTGMAQQAQADPMKQQMQQLGMAKEMAEVEKIKSDAILNMAKANQAGADPQIEMMKIQMQAQSESARQQAEVVKNQLDLQTQVVQAQAMERKSQSEAILAQMKMFSEAMRAQEQKILTTLKIQQEASKMQAKRASDVATVQKSLAAGVAAQGKSMDALMKAVTSQSKQEPQKMDLNVSVASDPAIRELAAMIGNQTMATLDGLKSVSLRQPGPRKIAVERDEEGNALGYSIQ